MYWKSPAIIIVVVVLVNDDDDDDVAVIRAYRNHDLFLTILSLLFLLCLRTPPPPPPPPPPLTLSHVYEIILMIFAAFSQNTTWSVCSARSPWPADGTQPLVSAARWAR